MGGGGGAGGRRALDAELNTIPMIDLMMVTISFLLITAVWSSMSRLDATTHAPSSTTDPPACEPHCDQRALHVDMRAETFVLTWKDGTQEIAKEEVPRHDVVVKEGETRVVRFPDLQGRLVAAWQERGTHRAPDDATRDRAVLHVDDGASYAEIVGAMDAIAAVKKPDRREESAFELALAAK